MTGGPPVVVMGVSGSGKSAVGAALAERLGVPFEDGDDLHPEANVAKMSSGIALDDDDRRPWLDRVGQWLAAHGDGGVIACSALKRRYRDQLRRHRPDVVVLQLDGDPALLAARLEDRDGHFMPASLLASQLEALEPLAADEGGVVLDVAETVDQVVDRFVHDTRR